MSSKLEVLKAELDALEAADAYDAPQYDWLCEQVERLTREETAKPSAPAPTTTTAPAGDPVAALVEEMQAAVARQAAGHDVDADALIARWNAQVADTAEQAAPRVDMPALLRDLATAGADPASLDDAARSELVRRHNQAVRQRPERRSTEVLRAELGSTDLFVRMQAAHQLQQRGEPVDDAAAAALVGEYNAAVRAQVAAVEALNPAAFPPELAEVVEGFREVQEAQRAPADPLEAATRRYNEFVRAQKPPTPEETLATLGVQAEPESQSVSTTTQEA